MSAVTALSAAAVTTATAAPARSVPVPQADPAPVVRFVAVGDISPAALGGQQQTANLTASLAPSRVLGLGDLQYPDGSYTDFMRYYDPTWGRFRTRTWPVPGNHEYRTAGAAGYLRYFGDRARPRGHTYYSFNSNGWHLVALNSELRDTARAEQRTWLRADLRANTQACVLAFWHKPRFSSGAHGSNPGQADLWYELYRARADVALNGHDHVYERFAPQTWTGAYTTDGGMRQFTIGTGGAARYPFGSVVANSQVRINAYDGVLKLDLQPGRYTWQYVSVDGQVRDQGSNRCH